MRCRRGCDCRWPSEFAGERARRRRPPDCALVRRKSFSARASPACLPGRILWLTRSSNLQRELEEMLGRDDIAALICVRGGYGSNYLLEYLDFERFIQHPKILLGCSDITSLLTAITDRTGLVTFHGPMVAKDLALGTFDSSSWNSALQGATDWNVSTDGVEVLKPGRARGRLYGGCLSMLVASLRTRFEVRTEGTILFIEDIAEKPFRIDRMLMQLRLAGKLEGVRGFVFGEMMDCDPPARADYMLQQVIMRVLSPYKVPIVYGLKSGHVTRDNITLPIGVHAELVAESAGVSLKVLEAATLPGA